MVVRSISVSLLRGADCRAPFERASKGEAMCQVRFEQFVLRVEEQIRSDSCTAFIAMALRERRC